MRSSTESEVVGVDDMMPIILWTCYFLLLQRYGMIESLLLQDNKPTRAKWKGLEWQAHEAYQHPILIHHRSSEHEGNQNCLMSHQEMVADFMTKPYHGSPFRNLRDNIMGRVRCIEPKADVITLGRKASKKLINSLTAIVARERQLFNKLRGTVVSCQIFIRSQSLIAP